MIDINQRISFYLHTMHELIDNTKDIDRLVECCKERSHGGRACLVMKMAEACQCIVDGKSVDQIVS
jgi:hypothetical protein